VCRRGLYMGGGWVSPAGSGRFAVISPSTEEVVGEVPLATDADIDRAVDAGRAAFDEGPWPRMAPDERADVLSRAAELLRRARRPRGRRTPRDPSRHGQGGVHRVDGSRSANHATLR